jgi:hypothetical protein
MRRPLLSIILILLAAATATAQEQLESRDNTIKLDLTSQLLFNRSVSVSYERYIRASQTAQITLGYHTFPSLRSIGNSVNVKDEKSASGLVAGGEYRFYLKKENRFAAPHGVYVGPYMAYHNFKNTRNISLTNEDGTVSNALLDTKLNILNIGVELGYQFMINQRWAIDIVFVGPSVSNYNINMKLDGDIDPSKLAETQREILETLADRFPFIKDLIEGEKVTASGKADTWSYGYRFQVQVGYHFGRKKAR